MLLVAVVAHHAALLLEHDKIQRHSPHFYACSYGCMDPENLAAVMSLAALHLRACVSDQHVQLCVCCLVVRAPPA